MNSYMKQGLGGSSSYDTLNVMKYISMVVTMKGNTCSVQLQKMTSSKKNLIVSLVVHLDP
jgi:hypothetical protein